MLKWGLAFLNHCTNRWIKCHHSADNAFFKHFFVHFGCIFTILFLVNGLLSINKEQNTVKIQPNISTLTIKSNVKLMLLLIVFHQECVITEHLYQRHIHTTYQERWCPAFWRVHASSGVKGLRHFPLLPTNIIAPAGLEGRGFSVVYLLNNTLNILNFKATKKQLLELHLPCKSHAFCFYQLIFYIAMV